MLAACNEVVFTNHFHIWDGFSQPSPTENNQKLGFEVLLMLPSTTGPFLFLCVSFSLIFIKWKNEFCITLLFGRAIIVLYFEGQMCLVGPNLHVPLIYSDHPH